MIISINNYRFNKRRGYKSSSNSHDTFNINDHTAIMPDTNKLANNTFEDTICDTNFLTFHRISNFRNAGFETEHIGYDQL